jgi:hypothetical protein
MKKKKETTYTEERILDTEVFNNEPPYDLPWRLLRLSRAISGARANEHDGRWLELASLKAARALAAAVMKEVEEETARDKMPVPFCLTGAILWGMCSPARKEVMVPGLSFVTKRDLRSEHSIIELGRFRLRQLATQLGIIKDDVTRLTFMCQSGSVMAKEILKVLAKGVWSKQSVQIVLPAYDRGIDYGAERKLLLKKGDKILYWQGGSPYWSSIGVTGYSPAGLHVVDPSLRQGSISTRLSEGRFSQARVAEVEKEILKFFGKECAPLPKLDTKTTYIWVAGEKK